MTAQQLDAWATPALWKIHGLIPTHDNYGRLHPLLDLIFCTLDDGNGKLSPAARTLDTSRWDLWKQLMYDDPEGLTSAVLNAMRSMQLRPPNPASQDELFDWAQQIVFFTLSSVPVMDMAYDPFGQEVAVAGNA